MDRSVRTVRRAIVAFVTLLFVVPGAAEIWGSETSGQYFTIQVGAFSKPSLAARRLSEMRGKGLTGQQRRDARTGRPLWVVQMGRYRTYDQAKADLPRVRRLLGDAIIVP